MGPEELARYRLRRVLGRGGRPGLYGGEVWEAEDTERPRSVALKILRVDDEEMLATQARFVRDAQLAACVRHPNVVRIHDAGEAAGTSFIVMELEGGKSLAAAAAEAAASTADRIRWLREAALGLAALHDADVAHRDVKADNVIVREDGTACLVDLGVPLEEAGHVADALDDQAAWGAMARGVLGAKEAPDVPGHVAAAVERAAASDRDARFSSMRDLAAALEGEAAAAEAMENAAPEPRRGPVRRTLHPLVAVLALVVLIAIAALLQRALLD